MKVRGDAKMHDCRRTKEQLIDLIFDEAIDTAALRAEAEACPGCRAELRALEATMRDYTRATDTARPSEDSWAGYHARLATRLRAVEIEHTSPQASPESSSPRLAPLTNPSTPSTTRPASFASRLGVALKATWHIPAPAAVAAALLFICLSAYALRPAPVPVAVEAPVARFDIPAPQVLRVEVPVVSERVVKRTIYVPREANLRDAAMARAMRDEMARRAPGARGNEQPVPSANTLVGFRPAADVRLRVIKGNYANEK
jgi:hypothetical protein